MKIAADTNLLLRAILEDDSGQAAEAQTLIERAELIAVNQVVRPSPELAGEEPLFSAWKRALWP